VHSGPDPEGDLVDDELVRTRVDDGPEDPLLVDLILCLRHVTAPIARTLDPAELRIV
jgi:hypothetical protein